jgi:hypothetical protein
VLELRSVCEHVVAELVRAQPAHEGADREIVTLPSPEA